MLNDEGPARRRPSNIASDLGSAGNAAAARPVPMPASGAASAERMPPMHFLDRIGGGAESRPALELGGKRHPAGAAAGTAHGDEDALLLLLVEIGSVEHLARLLLKQVVQREITDGDLVVGARGRKTHVRHQRSIRLRWLAFCRWFSSFHDRDP